MPASPNLNLLTCLLVGSGSHHHHLALCHEDLKLLDVFSGNAALSKLWREALSYIMNSYTLAS